MNGRSTGTCANRSWIAALVLLASFSLGMGGCRRGPATTDPELPVLGKVPEFSLLDQRGQPFGSADLRGKAWVGNFIFTRCPSICPLLTQKMGRVQEQTSGLGDSFRLVSFSVDPEYDLPPVLSAYAKAHGASSRWAFLTGDRAALRKTVVEGMKVHMAEGPTDDLMALTHGARFVLVDPQMQIRGYYGAEEDSSLAELLKDLRRLARPVTEAVK